MGERQLSTGGLSYPPSAAQGDVVGGPYTPVARTAVEVQGVKEGLTVGADEVLVIVCHSYDRRELEAVRDRMRDSGLRPEQILIFGGDVTIGKARREQIRMIVEGGSDG